MTAIPFVDLKAQQARIAGELRRRLDGVLAHCQFILGPEVAELEAELARFCGARHCVAVSSGTDAIQIAFMAEGIGPGDAVFCPAFTFAATAEPVALLGATPVFVDVEETSFNLAPASLARAIATAKQHGLRPKAVMPVDLFGRSADYDAIAPVAAAQGLFVLADAAQAFGAAYKGRKVGTLAPATITSFFPAKPLGCYGDGGAVFTDDDELASLVRSLRIHGEGVDRYDNVRVGMTGRLDSIQAAVLIEKLKIFPDEIVVRDRVARRYHEALGDVVIVPRLAEGFGSVWAQYTIRLPAGRRADVAAKLRADGVPTAIYYPKPLHRQEAFRRYPVAGNGLPVTERLAEEVLSLPMHAYLDERTQDRIVAAVRRAVMG